MMFGRPSDGGSDLVNQFLLPFDEGGNRDGELMPLLCYVPEIRLAVETRSPPD